MSTILANRKRAHLNSLTAKYPNTTIYEDFVRLESRILNNVSSYRFDPRTLALKETSIRVNQKGVSDNDLFVVTQIGIFIDSRVIAEQSAAVLQTYPNETHFTAAVMDVSDLEAVYNGTYSLKVGNYVFINRDTNRKFRVVQQTQQSSATNFSQSSEGTDFYNNEPLAIFSGKADNTLTIDLNLFTGISVESTIGTIENVITFEFRGYTVYNAADKFEEIAKSLGFKG